MEKIKLISNVKALDGIGQLRTRISFYLDTEDSSKARRVEKAIRKALAEEELLGVNSNDKKEQS